MILQFELLLLFLGLGASSLLLPPFVTYMILQFELLLLFLGLRACSPLFTTICHIILQFEFLLLFLGLGASSLLFCHLHDLQSLLIAKSKQGKDQVAELQTALDREKRCVKELKKELYKTEKRCMSRDESKSLQLYCKISFYC